MKRDVHNEEFFDNELLDVDYDKAFNPEEKKGGKCIGVIRRIIIPNTPDEPYELLVYDRDNRKKLVLYVENGEKLFTQILIKNEKYGFLYEEKDGKNYAGFVFHAVKNKENDFERRIDAVKVSERGYVGPSIDAKYWKYLGEKVIVGLEVEGVVINKRTEELSNHINTRFSLVTKTGKTECCILGSLFSQGELFNKAELIQNSLYQLKGYYCEGVYYVTCWDEVTSVSKEEYMKGIETTVEIRGCIKFREFPAPGEQKVVFSVVSGNESYDVVIDRVKAKGKDELREGEEYILTCESTEKGYEVISYSRCLIDLDDLPREGEDGNAHRREVLKKLDQKIFGEACIKKESGFVPLGIRLSGIPERVETKGEMVFFILRESLSKYICVYNPALTGTVKCDQLINSCQKIELYGALGKSVVYVRNYTMLASDEIQIRSLRPSNKRNKKMADLLEDEAKEEKRDKYTKVANAGRAGIEDEDDLYSKFLSKQEYYPPEVQTAIIRAMRDSSLKSYQKKKVLEPLVNAPWSRQLELKTDAKYLMDKLNETHYGQEYLKKAIIKILGAYESKTEGKGMVLLVSGPPGVGKTTLFQSAAKAAGMPFAKITLNGIDTPYFLKGTPRLYDNAITGEIVRVIGEVGDRAMILLDEVDKMATNGKEGNPYTALYDLLDTDALFQDSFVESGISLKDTVFVMTANDLASVPTPIIDRATMISVPDYTQEEKFAITKDYVIPKAMKKYQLNGKVIHWDEDIISDIANRFSITNGVRDIERNVNSVIRSALGHMKLENSGEITVNNTNVRELVDLPPVGRERIEQEISGLKNKFRCYKTEYGKEVCDAIAMKFVKYDSCKNDVDRELLRKQLYQLVNVVPGKRAEKYNLKKIKERLDSTHHSMEEVKEQILMSFAGMNASKKNGARCMLLNGPYGVGKTSICKTIADAMDRKFVKISLNGVDDVHFIKGHNESYKNAEGGAIMKTLADNGTDALLILLDEVDKMSKGASGNPYDALIDLLDDSGIFTDSFTNVPVDISNVFFIATSNIKENIPVAVMDRMELIELSGYCEEEKQTIAEEYIIPAKLKKYRVEKTLEIPSETVAFIVSNYGKAFGMRDVDKAVDKIIRKALKERELGNKIKNVSTEFVEKTLGAKPLKRGNVASSGVSRPGIARALAVSGNSGTTFAIQVASNPYGTKDEITGLPKQSTLDSIKIAKYLVSKLLGKELKPVCIHFAEGGIEKDGPSAGITLFSAIYSHFTGKEISRNIAFTGEIDLFGDIWPIGGVDLKLTAAENEGCTEVFIPVANYKQLVENGTLGKYKCRVIPVENVKELVGELFETEINAA